MTTSLIQLLFSFKGRIPRSYWWPTMIAAAMVADIAISLVEHVAKLAGSGTMDADTQEFYAEGPYAIAVSIISLVNVWISYALSVKRLHDRDRTAWWLVAQAALLVVTILLIERQVVIRAFNVAWVPGIFAIALSLWLTIEIGFLKGTAGPNRFGPDPLAEDLKDAHA